jgi:hypothetical protein
MHSRYLIFIAVLSLLLTSGCVSDTGQLNQTIQQQEERKEPPLPPPIPPITGDAAASDFITGMQTAGGDQHPDYPNFRFPLQDFTLSKTSITFADAQETQQLSISVQDAFIYQHAFISYAGSNWQEVQLEGSLGTHYITDSATAPITLEPGDFDLTQPGQSASNNYLVAYTCSVLPDETTDCHDGWQIWNFSASLLEGELIITASSYEQDPYHPPEDAHDGDISTRWSAEGDGEWIQFTYPSEMQINLARIAFLSGDQRWAEFSIEISDDGSSWNRISDHLRSSGTTNDLQDFPLSECNTRFARLVGHGNQNSDWNSITELNFTYQAPAEPTCSDGIMNCPVGGECETGIDCGGSCPNQDCCTNDHMDSNLGETGIDCGGDYCEACYAGTTYYISNSSLGNNSNNGTQPYSPWKTISKVNSYQGFKPGDRILFMRGDVWRETLTVPLSGTEDAYITFGAYGDESEGKPGILGSEQATNWIEVQTNIWSSSTVLDDPYVGYDKEIWFEENDGNVSWGNAKKPYGCSPPNADCDNESCTVRCDNIPKVYCQLECDSFPCDKPCNIDVIPCNMHCDGGDDVDCTFECPDIESLDPFFEMENEYDWTWNANNIYVYSPENPSTRYSSLEVPQRPDIITLNEKEYIEINGFDLSYGLKGVTGGDYPMVGHTGAVIRNCEISCLGTKDGEGYGTAVVYNDMLIEHNTIHDCGRRGVAINNYGNTDISNITVQYNTFYNGYHTTGVDVSTGSGSFTGNLENIFVRNNLMYDIEDRPTSVGRSELNWVQGPHGGTGQVLGYYFYNNILMYPSQAALAFQDVDGSYVFNNVFYGHNTQVPWGNTRHVGYGDECTNAVLKNNIFYTDLPFDDQSCGVLIYASMDSQDYHEIDANHNLYYRINDGLRIIDRQGEVYVVYYMSDIREDGQGRLQLDTGWELNGTTGNPLFVDPENGDFRLQAGSPAIGAGTAIPGVLIPGVTTDRNGIPYSDPPSIGAYEYQ